jgi:transcriptional regulator with XRE-family HTH domain
VTQDTPASELHLRETASARTYLGSIERGERNVTIQSADKLARALETTLTDLFLELEKGADICEEQ